LKSKVFENLHLLVIAVAVFAIGAYAVTFRKLPHDEDPAAWGQLGDFLGGLLNPIVSICTLVVAIAVWKLQRVEMEQTRNALTEQAKTAEQQRQEQRFFDLLNLYHRTVDSISVTHHVGATSAFLLQGKAALSRVLGSAFDSTTLGQYWWKELPASYFETSPFALQNAKGEWAQVSNVLDHYFRSIFRLLDDSENLLFPNHFRYVKLLRTQLNGNEVTLLALNMWLDDEGTKIIPLAEKYGILKHLPSGQLRSHLENVFPPNVFGRKFAESRRATSKTI
jgi:hypothetical protein